jgi:hypothetical protein
MKKENKTKESNLIAFLITGLIPCLFIIVNFIFDYTRSNNEDSLNYMNMALAYRPIIVANSNKVVYTESLLSNSNA